MISLRCYGFQVMLQSDRSIKVYLISLCWCCSWNFIVSVVSSFHLMREQQSPHLEWAVVAEWVQFKALVEENELILLFFYLLFLV